MNTLLPVLAGIAVFTHFYIQASNQDEPQHFKFVEWVRKHQKSYGSVQEMLHRQAVFLKNLRVIEENNLKMDSEVEYGENEFMDLEYHEFKVLMMSGRHHIHKDIGKEEKVRYLNLPSVPESVDWRNMAVSAVKNQGRCGGCWAFSAAGALEGAFAIKYNHIEDLSVQQIIDCCKIDLFGCNGGDPIVAFEKCLVRDGIMRAKHYPFEGVEGDMCQLEFSKVERIAQDYTIVPPNNPNQLKQALSLAPVSVCISDGPVFHLYKKGIIKGGDCGKYFDHCLLAVGYGSEDGVDYWILKNSWGTSWGESGYVRVKREDGVQGPGICGVASEPSYINF